MITVDALFFDYPGTRALDGISFQAGAGSVVALVGPNGAGKTTLLRCLAALEEPYAGTIRIDGIDAIEQPRAAHQRIGFLPDHFGVYPTLSARRCLLHAACSRGLWPSQATARTAETAREVGLSGHLDKPAGTLSRGQRQRLAIAQAIIHRPAVLLLDEPASGLDPQARVELAGLLRRLGDEGMSIVVSSHILAELEAYCTTMLVLREGRVAEQRELSPPARSTRSLRLRLSDATAATTAITLLAAQAGVRAVRHEEATLHFDFTGDEGAQAALLRALVEHGVPVSAFSAAAGPGLQDAYLAAVTAERPT